MSSWAVIGPFRGWWVAEVALANLHPAVLGPDERLLIRLAFVSPDRGFDRSPLFAAAVRKLRRAHYDETGVSVGPM